MCAGGRIVGVFSWGVGLPGAGGGRVWFFGVLSLHQGRVGGCVHCGAEEDTWGERTCTSWASRARTGSSTSGPSTRATAIRGRSAKAATAIANARGELRAVATMVSVTLWSAGRLSRWDRTVVITGNSTKKIISGATRASRLG